MDKPDNIILLFFLCLGFGLVGIWMLIGDYRNWKNKKDKKKRRRK